MTTISPIQEANNLIREIITYARQNHNYRPSLKKLRKLAGQNAEVDVIYKYLIKSLMNRVNNDKR